VTHGAGAMESSTIHSCRARRNCTSTPRLPPLCGEQAVHRGMSWQLLEGPLQEARDSLCGLLRGALGQAVAEEAILLQGDARLQGVAIHIDDDHTKLPLCPISSWKSRTPHGKIPRMMMHDRHTPPFTTQTNTLQDIQAHQRPA